MSIEALIYPLLFLGLYFEVFLVLTLFDRESRRRRALAEPASFPSVAVIVPCHNEEKNIRATIDSVLALHYPADKLSVIAVNDGSIDGTGEVLEYYRDHPRVTVVHKENGGKHTALNAGIEITHAEFVGCLDADSTVVPEALKRIIANFDAENIGAVTAAMTVNQPENILEKIQEAEYLIGVAMRHTLAVWNGLYVTPGPFTIYRKKVFEELGPFRSAHNTEDLEIALRLQRGGWKIGNAPAAGVYTNVPKTAKALIKQRVRWTTGFMRNVFDYRDLIGNRAYGVLGLLVLPLGVVSILAGVVLFGVSLFRFGSEAFSFALRASEVPLSFTFAPHLPDIFYAPISALSLLTLTIVAMTLALVFVGARLVRVRTTLGVSLIGYFILYSVIAFWWRVRALSDIVLGVRRSWR